MATTLLNAAAVSGTSPAVSGVNTPVPDRSLLIVSDNVGATVQPQVSADNTNWVNLGSPVSNGSSLIRVAAALAVRVVLTRTAGTASAWVA